MSNFLKVAAFSLVVIGAYTAFSVWFVPPVGTGPAPAVVERSAPLDSAGLVRLGREVFNGKGSCTLCHNAVGGRAPLLDDVALRASERLSDKRYKGKATDAASYIRESMLDPSAYVVAGYGVAGSNDTVSPMPDVAAPPIGLTPIEVDSVIAYLQDKAGVEVTVRPPSASGAKSGEAGR